MNPIAPLLKTQVNVTENDYQSFTDSKELLNGKQFVQHFPQNGQDDFTLKEFKSYVELYREQRKIIVIELWHRINFGNLASAEEAQNYYRYFLLTCTDPSKVTIKAERVQEIFNFHKNDLRFTPLVTYRFSRSDPEFFEVSEDTNTYTFKVYEHDRGISVRSIFIPKEVNYLKN